VKLETGEYSTGEKGKPEMMYANAIKNLKKLQQLISVILTVIARMTSDSGDAAEYLAKVTAMNFPDIMRLTTKGIRIALNCLKSKHSCGYDEMTT